MEEKSGFEKSIIEAFKQSKVSEMFEKLETSLTELPKYIEELKKQSKVKNQVFILNSNIIDKISRIMERNYININILISKIFISLLVEENFKLLSDNSSLLINLSNQIMAILDDIKYTENYYELIKTSINYMKYLTENSSEFLSEEQTKIIEVLKNQLNSKLTSNAFLNIKNNYITKILSLCKGETPEEKLKGIELLNSQFYELHSLNEQFDILCLYGEEIIKSIMSEPDPSLIDIYFKFSYFFMSFLYNSFYKINLNTFENDFNSNIDDNLKKLNEQYYILDSMEENIEIPENLYITKYHGREYRNMKLINNVIYELEGNKNILLNHTSIFSLAINIINCLISFDKLFKAQFVCFLILKRLYFIFPKYRNDLCDLIVNVMINIINFDKKLIKSIKDIFEPFLFYLLIKGEKNIKNILKEKFQKTKTEIKNYYLNNENTPILEKRDIQSDIIFINNFNLNIGYPMNIEVNAGYEEERLIEIKSPNSLLYIGFNLLSYDINFHLIKYCPNLNNSLKSNEKIDDKVQYEEHKYFYEIFKLEKSQGAKIILFIKNPGIYKDIFDNKYSWFNNKLLRYRCTIMKEYFNLGLSAINSSDYLKLEGKDNSDNNINNDIKNNEDDKKEEEEEKKEENKDKVKIAVKFENKLSESEINMEEALNFLDSDIQ